MRSKALKFNWMTSTAVFVLVVVFYYFLVSVAYYNFTDEKIFYSLIIFYRATGIYVVWGAWLAFFIVLIYWLPKRSSGKYSIGTKIVCLLLPFIAMPFACWVTLPFFTELGTTFTHAAKINDEHYLYQVALLHSAYDAGYSLYRCDSLGFVCDRLHYFDASTGTAFEGFGDYRASQNMTLTIEHGNTVVATVNGENFFSYPLTS